MWWWLLAAACELVVDFAPPEGVADTGDVSPLIRGTRCSGFVADVGSDASPLDAPLAELPGPVMFDDLGLGELLVAADTSVEVTLGRVAGPTVTPPRGEGVIVFANAEGSRLVILAACALESCAEQTLRITLPTAMPRIVSDVQRGDVTITDAATTDVVAITSRGDVTITGEARGVHAEASDGSVWVDVPAAEYVDLRTSTGRLTMRGTATRELCAFSDLGNLDVRVDASERVWLHAANGDIQAYLASRVARLELDVAAGRADVGLPSGAYDLDLVSIPEERLLLWGIERDPSAADRLTGTSLGEGTVLTGF